MDSTEVLSKSDMWGQRIKDYHSSGLTCKEWCEQNQISVSTRGYWILANSTSRKCNDSQKFSFGVVKTIRTGYNANKEYCDNSQKLSLERWDMIWK